LDIHELCDFADYFVLCSGTSDRMLQALADEVQVRMRQDRQLHSRIEGLPEHGWILLDYGDVVLHLFSPDRRQYYRLEELWSKARVVLHLL
jgi:ribosome-associated protein